MKYVCRFEFEKTIEPQFIEKEIIDAIMVTEDVFGEAKVQMNASYYVSGNKAVIDVSNEIGEHVFSVFTGRLNRVIGRDRYSFQRVPANN